MSVTANRLGCRHPVSTDAQIFQNSMIQDATQEAQLANKNMPDLQPAIFVAEEMGEGLG